MPLKLSKSALVSAMSSVVLGCAGAAYSEKDNSYTFTGELGTQSYTDFAKIISTKKIKIVIFKDCDGGSVLAGLDIAKAIKLAGLETLASGRVVSACALAYLGGVVRKVDALNPNNGIQFHGTFDPTNWQPAGPVKNQKVLDYLYLDTNFKFSKEIQEIILNTKLPFEGVYFFRQLVNGKFRDSTLYCDGKVPFEEKNCKRLDGLTLESEGIVTK
jgi:hypothetical protein